MGNIDSAGPNTVTYPITFTEGKCIRLATPFGSSGIAVATNAGGIGEKVGVKIYHTSATGCSWLSVGR